MKNQTKFKTIDEYITACAPDVRSILQDIRRTIRKVVPKAEEKISYQMPALTLDGRDLIYFAAFKKHIGLFPPVRGDEKLSEELSRFKGEKGNLKFPLSEPIPYGLIRRVVACRLKEHQEKAASTQRSPKKNSTRREPTRSATAKEELTTKFSDTNSVDAYMKTLKHPLAEAVEALRKIILSTGAEIGEEIKWNGPAFFFKGEMKPFDPKEYKRHLVVFNLFKKDCIRLVFWRAGKIDDKSGFLEGDYADGRRLALFRGMADVKTKKRALQDTLKRQLKHLDK